MELIKYTNLAELWDIFQEIVSISPVSEQGFTLLNAAVYLDGLKIPASRREFWKTMSYFLSRLNNKFIERQKQKMAQRGK